MHDVAKNGKSHWVAISTTLIARLVTAYWRLTDKSARDSVLFGQAILKSGLLIVILVLYRCFAWPSLYLLAVWPIGFLYAWLGPPHATLRVLALGLLAGVSFFIAWYGVRTLRRISASENRPTIAV